MCLIRERSLYRVHSDPSLATLLALARTELRLEGRIRALHHKLSDANLQQIPEFRQRMGVLRELGYVDPGDPSDHMYPSEHVDDGGPEGGGGGGGGDTVGLKGRVACELTDDGLIGCELIFRGVLTDLEPEEAVALLSALVFQEKTGDEEEARQGLSAPTPGLETAVATVNGIAGELADVQVAHGLDIDPEVWCQENLKWGLLRVVYHWACGMSFREISQLTEVMEGSIVRTVLRLEEKCREVRNAARVMGNTALYQKMEQASLLIKRDIVFAASLYVS